ncbi:hypothetical protein EVAR_23714_1 [Eumeta japonica]|uniref:Uncharacterized protein n=1 Tax=Eumeta variegata TaxID=151549 RepID=A0A4C1VFN0_EUMVA|nr:hypothetical protein EVAR_23714_1 [Eumeta japonica]
MIDYYIKLAFHPPARKCTSSFLLIYHTNDPNPPPALNSGPAKAPDSDPTLDFELDYDPDGISDFSGGSVVSYDYNPCSIQYLF